jgi:hypothetical protein
MSGSSRIIDGRLVQRQGRALWLAEFARAPQELAAFAAAFPALAAGRHGDGHPRLACLDTADARHENVEVVAGHLGLGVSPLSVSVVWDRLVQREGEWRPYAGLDRAMAGA